MAQFPINLNLAGRPVLVVGGGRIAHRKVQQLLMAEADVTVLAPSIIDELRTLPVAVIEREYERGDVNGHRLVITATGVLDVDQQIFDDCEDANIWVNSADDPARCTFTLPATMRRGELMITVSTAGASPALASFLRSRLEAAIGPDFGRLVDRLADERAAVHARGESTEDVNWTPIISRAIREMGIETPLLIATEVSL